MLSYLALLLLFEIDVYLYRKKLHLNSFYITLKLFSLNFSYLNQGLLLKIYK